MKHLQFASNFDKYGNALHLFVFGKRAECPVCGSVLDMDFNTDFLCCLLHGRMSGMAFMETQGMPRWMALIEIRAEQAKDELRAMSQAFKDNAKYFGYSGTLPFDIIAAARWDFRGAHVA